MVSLLKYASPSRLGSSVPSLVPAGQRQRCTCVFVRSSHTQTRARARTGRCFEVNRFQWQKWQRTGKKPLVCLYNICACFHLERFSFYPMNRLFFFQNYRSQTAGRGYWKSPVCGHRLPRLRPPLLGCAGSRKWAAVLVLRHRKQQIVSQMEGEVEEMD